MSNDKLAVIKDSLTSVAFEEKFKEVNSFGLNLKREVGFAIQALQGNTYLASADKNSILKSVYNAALTGFTLNPTLSQAYLVPRRVGGNLVCCLDPSYQGLISKMIDMNQAKDIYSHVVFEGDEFIINFATNEIVKHVPYYLCKQPKGEPVGVYAIAVLPDGSRKPAFLPMERIYSIRDRSESYKSFKAGKAKSTIWEGPDKEEMWKKTAVKFLWKYMPKNNREAEIIATIVENDNEANGIDFHKNDVDKSNEKGKDFVQEANDRLKEVQKKKEEKASKLSPDYAAFEEVPDAQRIPSSEASPFVGGVEPKTSLEEIHGKTSVYIEPPVSEEQPEPPKKKRASKKVTEIVNQAPEEAKPVAEEVESEEEVLEDAPESLEGLFAILDEVGDPEEGKARRMKELKAIFYGLTNHGFDGAKIKALMEAQGLEYKDKEKLCSLAPISEIKKLISTI